MTACGRPDEAIRIAALRDLPQAPATVDWLAGQVTAVSAEAMLAAGEPQQAIAAVTVGLPVGSPERSVLTATARRDIGDVRGAAAAMASVADDLLLAPRATQLQGWVLQARLAHDRGQSHRANLLVERVLRVAGAEEFRRPAPRGRRVAPVVPGPRRIRATRPPPLRQVADRPRRAVAAKPGVLGEFPTRRCSSR